MKKRLLMAIASVAVLSVATVAQGETVRRNYSAGARAAACKKDCTSGNLHGNYRPYGAADPKLVSPEGRKMFNECVRLCLDPLPGFYVQKSIVESGGSWFGKTKADCLTCHASGKPRRYWPGINVQPDSLKREGPSS
jgi:hypothetical protein